jgi:hypothetical protein
VGRSSDPGFGVGAATIPSERIRSRLPIQTVNGRADLWRKWGSAPTSDYAGPKTGSFRRNLQRVERQLAHAQRAAPPGGRTAIRNHW